MINFFKNNRPAIFAFLFFVSILPFIGKLLKKDFSGNVDAKDELYNPALLRINSIEKAISYVDSVYSTKYTSTFDTAGYVHAASKFTKEKFYHGLSRYSFSDNWIAYFGAKLFWSHLSAIVDPNDIIKHPEGLCSQQTIVFMEILKHRHINVRYVGLGYKEGPGHFLSEVRYNNSWRLYDVTMEPKWSKVKCVHESMDYYLTNRDSLYQIYDSRLDKTVFDKILKKIEYGKPNEFPAKKMLLLHQITYIFTYLFPLFFIVMFIFSYRAKGNNKEKVQQVYTVVTEPDKVLESTH